MGLSRLFKNVTIRELLLLTVVVALVVHLLIDWGSERARVRTFTAAYSDLQRQITTFREREQALRDFEIAITAVDDPTEAGKALQLVEQHNKQNPNLAFCIYFEPHSNRWFTTFVNRGTRSIGGSYYVYADPSDSPSDSIESAAAYVEMTTPSRIYSALLDIGSQPSLIEFDETNRSLVYTVPLELELDKPTLQFIQRQVNSLGRRQSNPLYKSLRTSGQN